MSLPEVEPRVVITESVEYVPGYIITTTLKIEKTTDAPQAPASARRTVPDVILQNVVAPPLSSAPTGDPTARPRLGPALPVPNSSEQFSSEVPDPRDMQIREGMLHHQGKFYTVFHGCEVGIFYDAISEVQPRINSVPNALSKGYKTWEEALAEYARAYYGSKPGWEVACINPPNVAFPQAGKNWDTFQRTSNIFNLLPPPSVAGGHGPEHNQKILRVPQIFSFICNSLSASRILGSRILTTELPPMCVLQGSQTSGVEGSDVADGLERCVHEEVIRDLLKGLEAQADSYHSNMEQCLQKAEVAGETLHQQLDTVRSLLSAKSDVPLYPNVDDLIRAVQFAPDGTPIPQLTPVTFSPRKSQDGALEPLSSTPSTSSTAPVASPMRSRNRRSGGHLVLSGRDGQHGVFNNWVEANVLISGVSNPMYRAFDLFTQAKSAYDACVACGLVGTLSVPWNPSKEWFVLLSGDAPGIYQRPSLMHAIGLSNLERLTRDNILLATSREEAEEVWRHRKNSM
ncbi:hypothetical protein VNI00_018002 [Paramarasmius palmivorus]|uniref:Ribonuclease H1 N-terminal domain-containing protein n=1 Tax=Paramarasmius palmivorus TaxID=297713 RepID=A0AAW0B373_9AGAR